VITTVAKVTNFCSFATKKKMMIAKLQKVPFVNEREDSFS